MTQPTDEQTIEAEIWVACVDGLRDWTSLEREWIQSHEIEQALLQWWESNASEGCWTNSNHAFMTHLATQYQHFQKIQKGVEASTDELQTPSADLLQTAT